MHACKTILAYFHFACAGSIPFSIVFDESREGNRESHHGMTPDQLDYLRQIRKEIFKQGWSWRYPHVLLLRASVN